MLSWIAAVVFADKDVTARQLRQRHTRLNLDALTRMTIHLIILRAGDLAPRRRPHKFRFWKHGRDLRRRHFMRSFIGSRLRRAFRHRDLATRIATLIAALRNLDAYTHLVQRRITRLWGIAPTPDSAQALLRAPVTHVRGGLGEGGSPAFANTS